MKYQAPPQVIRFYEALMEQINGSNGKEVAYLRMAWGSGWRGMTGDWMTHEQFEAAKTFERFGRIVGAVFPKTRRLTVKDGIPCLPMGWVKIRPTKQRSLSVPKVSPETKGITKGPEEIKSKVQQEFPRAERPLSSLKSEIWEGATITYNPGKREFVVNYQGKKATFKDETLLPSSITNRLVEKRQPTNARVEVELEGNYHKVVRVEAQGKVSSRQILGETARSLTTEYGLRSELKKPWMGGKVGPKCVYLGNLGN